MIPDVRHVYLRMRAGLLALVFMPGLSVGQVTEVEDPKLPMVVMYRTGPEQESVVAYNPSLCDRLGVACGFLRMHAQGHAFYGHPPVHPAKYSEREETLADCWAARRGDPVQILAAHQWFTSGRNQQDWGVFGDTRARARNIRDCAIQGGNWLGN